MYQGRPQAIHKRDRLHHAEPRHELADTMRVAAMGMAYEQARGPYGYDEHVHDNHELILVDRGQYRCRINSATEDMVLGPGSLVLICPGDRHADRCAPPLAYYTVWFRLRRALIDDGRGQLRLLRSDLDQDRHVFHDCPGIAGLLQRMDADARQEHRFGWPLQQAHTQALVWHLAEIIPADLLDTAFLDGSAAARWQQRLYECFRAAEGQTLSVDQMAREMGLAPSTFAHRCRQLLGTSPGQLWLTHRIERAQFLLRSGDETIAELARRLGFADASHFVHRFKRATGMSPGQFRRSEPLSA